MIKTFLNKEPFFNFNSSPNHFPWRLMLICFIFIMLISLLIGRLFQLHILHTDFLQAQGNARTLKIVNIPSYRGMIMDRRHRPLAISTPVYAIWINPQHFAPSRSEKNKLANLLNISLKELNSKIAQNPKRSFVYLKRGVTPAIAKKIEQLKIEGLSSIQEFRRYYPQGEITSQLIGFTDIDDVGQAGLEYTFNEHLKPLYGKKRVLEDRRGHWVQDIDHLKTAHSGQDLILSIDSRIQSMAYKELKKIVSQTHAQSATLVMLDVRTGEVLAMLSVPSFNPNNRIACHGPTTRNRAVTDLIEPGSVIKPFSIASVLRTRQYTPESIIDTTPGTLNLGHHIVKDLHNYGPLSLKEILSKSSNVGISKITLATPPTQLLDTFRSLGLGSQVLTPFPGERQGILPPPPKNEFVHATLAFGYGLSVTALQLAHAYATLAMHGVKRPVSLTKIDDLSLIDLSPILPIDVAQSCLGMLTEVLTKEGTGSRAHISGFKTAGKTGTTRIVGPKGYDHHRHNALFAGITPVDNPRLVTVVLVEEPLGAYYGGLVAAPIYRNVVSQALYMLNVPPDA